MKVKLSNIAQETLEICKLGRYTSANGIEVNIASDLEFAKKHTRMHSGVRFPPQLNSDVNDHHKFNTRITVKNETAFSAIQRFSVKSTEKRIACMNFASAKLPGGGWLNGRIAQEECLAYASGLYECLLQVPQFYQDNTEFKSEIYLDTAVYSEAVPFFRDDAYQLLYQPVYADIITVAAPNRSVLEVYSTDELPYVETALIKRAMLTLNLAKQYKATHLVLGAWGCGVFGNDPSQVAFIFHTLLNGAFKNCFEEVCFAVYDCSSDKSNFKTFKKQF